ncbi:MAG: FAD-dependent oxidoreductase [Candidatus Rokubacteria bacterium]|nr:FAD-dependent oxidoreductase [Candidatus Rokubacteria bacterium]
MVTGFESVRYRSWRPHTENKTGAQRYERPVYDWASKTSPCREGCPTGHDIALALLLIAQGRPDLAYRVFREESPFPAITGRVCYHPCEAPCNRERYDEPLSIAQLERFTAEHAGDDAPLTVGVEHDSAVAVVGSGPAGLSCAYHLRRLGYRVTVYEASSEPGGALRYGIPAYRLPRNVLEREIARLQAQGVAFRCGVGIGEQMSFGRLREDYAAVFLGVGLCRARRLAVPGADKAGVVSGLEVLRGVNQGARVRLGRRVVVIGGGDVAVDVARVARRRGAAEVVMCAVEGRSELPAHPEEAEAAEQEAVRIEAGWAPVEILARDGALAVAVARATGVRRDASGAVTFRVDRAKVRELAAETVVCAIGQELERERLPEGLADGARVAVGEWGDTALPGVFAGGDASGTYNVVQALGAGKRAAIGIDLYLQSRGLPDLARRIGVGARGAVSFASYLALVAGRPEPARAHVVAFPEINLDYFRPAARVPKPEVDPATRLGGFVEVAASLGAPAAQGEARRCFTCGFCSMCGNCFVYCPDAAITQRADWGFEIDLDFCKGCGVCVQECPRAAMSMIPEEEA